tara:strand:+ start:15110 stop:17209 length:2100 start_codon:yes stop_codon:yes gene_type:complete
MGGVFGHMSHIYDNPYMTFGQIKDVMRQASAGELQGTEKTDGQNLFVSYNVNDGTVRSARNKGNIKAGGMTPAELLEKFEGRGALTDAFVNSFYAFEEAVESLSDEEQIAIFGPDTNIYYNAEVMDPGSANVINYDKKTFLIHRAGHAAYDRETGKPIPGQDGKDFGEEQAAKLQGALERTQDKMSKRDFKVQVNAIRNLEGLGNDEDLTIALNRLDQFMSEVGVDENDSIGNYIVKSLDKLISQEIPELNREAKKLLIKRIMEDYYGVIEGSPGPKKVRGLETRQILKVAADPKVNDRVKELATNYPSYLKKIIFPVEDIIHDFAVEMLRSLQSAFVLDNNEELSRQRGEVDKAIKAIEGSDSEEAMEILRVHMEKLKNLEGVSSAAEGFVFDYDGNTYKFTGGFAPMNQILGLFKYGRKGIPALGEERERQMHTALPTGRMSGEHFILNEKMGQNIALYPGKFKPPHGGHFNVAKSVLENPGVDKLIVFVSPKVHEGMTPQQAVAVWNVYKKYLPGDVDIRVADITPVRSVYEYIDDEAESGDNLHLILGEKDIEGGRFKTAAGRREDVEVSEVPIPPQMGGVSATHMRRALVDNDDKTFIAGLPTELSDIDINDIMRILGSELDEISGGGGSSMGGGAIGGVSSSGIAGYSLPLGAKPRHPEIVGSEKKKKRKKDEFLKEELVSEVMDYLLGISVG